MSFFNNPKSSVVELSKKRENDVIILSDFERRVSCISERRVSCMSSFDSNEVVIENCSFCSVLPIGWCSSSHLLILTSSITRAFTMRKTSLPVYLEPFGRKDILVALLWIACGWIPLALDFTLYFIRGYNTHIPLSPQLFEIQRPRANSSIPTAWSIPTAAPTWFTYDFFQGDTRDLIFIWTKLFSRTFVFIPLISIINLSILTNMFSFEGWELKRKLAFIYFTQILIAGPYAAGSLIEWGDKTMDWLKLCVGTMLFNLTLGLGWYVLARGLSMDWEINVKWLPALQLCQALVPLVTGMAVVGSKELLRDILIYVPLLLWIFELVFKKVLTCIFHDHRSNSRGLILSMAFTIFPMEVFRFASFLLIFMQYKLHDAPFSRIVKSVGFSIISDIYTHTGISAQIKKWINSSFVGVRRNEFLEVHMNYASVRGLLEIVAPTFLVTNILMSNACFYHLPILSAKWNFIFFSSSKWFMEQGLLEALAIYYIAEVASFCLCYLICKFMSYQPLSAMGGLKWSNIVTMIVFVGAAVNVPTTGYGLVRLERE